MSDSDPTGSRGSREPTTADGASERPERETVQLTVIGEEGDRTELSVEVGRNLRRVLLETGRSPYARATRRLNCAGRGLCATCGVRICEGPAPKHWHDRLAERFGYPRLSCQVTVDRAMTVELVAKRVWGPRETEPPSDDG